MSDRIYLDNAATSWPKPEGVYQCVEAYLRQQGAAAGRSVYREAQQTQHAVGQARSKLARFLGVARPEWIIFAANGTDALNLAIHGLLRPGDHVVTTAAEHNSVLRPLAHWRDDRQVEVTYVDVDSTGRVDPDDVRGAIRTTTRLVAVTAASNVTGVIQPVKEIANQIQGTAALLLVDAAQTAGHFPISVADLGCDLLATPGHKGLLGILGTGVLALGPRAAEQLGSVRQGGTGTRSETDRQPEELPDRLEAGNLNVPGVLSLATGVDYLHERGWESLRQHEIDLTSRLRSGMQSIAGIEVFGPKGADQSVGVVSVRAQGYDPQEVAMLLDEAYGVQVRAGVHCAPRLHSALGTSNSGGSVRFSPGPFTTVDQIEAAIAAMGEIAQAARMV